MRRRPLNKREREHATKAVKLAHAVKYPGREFAEYSNFGYIFNTMEFKAPKEFIDIFKKALLASGFYFDTRWCYPTSDTHEYIRVFKWAK